MAFELPPLPYAMNALEPHVSKETLEYHYGKHHNAYVTHLNKLTEGKPEAGKSLEDIIRSASGGMFNNAAQVWNHTFYWNCLSPAGGGEPQGALADAISSAFGSFQDFHQQFTQASATLFGSGWAWLVKTAKGGLEIVQTQNAGCPITDGHTPLLTCDVWEHAYYIDRRNARPAYIEAWWKLVNWEWVSGQLEG